MVRTDQRKEPYKSLPPWINANLTVRGLEVLGWAHANINLFNQLKGLFNAYSFAIRSIAHLPNQCFLEHTGYIWNCSRDMCGIT
jgi:hypothetical protein